MIKPSKLAGRLLGRFHPWLILLVLALGLGWLPVSAANVFYVSPTGSGDGSTTYSPARAT